MTETLSIDHTITERYRDEDGEHFMITNFSAEGDPLPKIQFKKGDKEKAFKYLGELAKLFGVE